MALGNKNTVWENTRLHRWSQEWAQWLINVCEKRGLDEIWVAFTNKKFGKFNKENLKRYVGE